MNPDGPTAISVTLVGGPCDGQVVNVWRRPDGCMPPAFEACRPAPPRDGNTPPDSADYFTYVRSGDAHTTRVYVHWRYGVPDA